MTISKKMFLVAVAGLSFAGSSVYATSSADARSFKSYVQQAKDAVEGIAKKSWSNAKDMYREQKNALKAIKDRLKRSAKAAKASASATWQADRALYKAFKTDVYKNWKKNRTFSCD